MIAGDDELELRREVKEVLAHKPRGKLVAAGSPLIFASAHRLPPSVSVAVTMRRPTRLASSVG